MRSTHEARPPGDLDQTAEALRELQEANERLILAGLREQELAERARRSEEEVKTLLERESLLATASTLLDSSLDHETTLGKTARLAVPRLADWCVVDLASGGSVEQVAVAHVNAGREQLLRELGRRLPPEDLSFGVGHVLRTGRPDIYPDVADAGFIGRALGVEHPRLLRELGARSYMCVPLKAREEVIGVLSLVYSESGRRFHGEDLELAVELARRASFAIDNARLYREAQLAIRMRDDVLAVVSHDLRNPLASILVSAEGLLRRMRGDEPSGWKRPVENIRRSASHMRWMIDELVELASIQVGRLALERAHESLPELVDDVLEMLEATVRAKSLRVDTRIPAEMEPVCCDRERIVRVFTNLLTNAIKFTPQGGRIAIEAASTGGELRVSVADTGPGIAQADLPRLFEPYWKGAHTGRRGTGLGLYIAQGIVRAHGGRIWAESEPGSGSRFFFTIPGPDAAETRHSSAA